MEEVSVQDQVVERELDCFRDSVASVSRLCGGPTANVRSR